MRVARARLAVPSWLRLPRRTARLRLAALCGGLFLLSGVALVAVTYVLFQHATNLKRPQLPKIPHTPSVQSLQFKPEPPVPSPQQFQPLGQAHKELALAQHHLARAYGLGPLHLVPIQHQLAEVQHQLAQGQSQLAAAVHQLAQASSVQAAQRAADSHQLLVNSGIALGVVTVLALLAAWLAAGRMLRPIRTITSTARRISSSSLHERLALDGPQDELRELGDTLDDLLSRLDSAFEAQRNFVANASHELRTPLTAERTLLQVALDDPNTTNAAWRSTAEEVLASSDEQERLIHALLTLASSESGLKEHEPVDLAAVVTAFLVDLQPEIERRGIQIDTATTPARVQGDPVLVERLVANLLTNAVRHNVAGGRVEVVTAATEGQAVLSVTNTGALIPPGEVDRLFQPFQRLDPRRAHHPDGQGLGLSIVRAIANAHHGSISAEPLPGGGLSVSVVFAQPATLS
jgi:signal transduction histidine kinase